MKLLIHCAAPFDQNSGVNKVALSVGKELQKKGIEAQFVFLYGAPAPHFNYMPWLEKSKLLSLLRHTPISALFFCNFLKKHSFDLIHSHSPEAGFDSLVATRLLNRKTPVAITLHGLDKAIEAEWNTEIAQKKVTFSWGTYWYLFWSNFKARYSFAHAASFSSISNAVDREAKKFFHTSTTIIQNGFDSAAFYPKPNKNKIRRELSLPTDKKIILFVGDNGWRKGLSYLVQALEHLSDEFILVIVGLSQQPADLPLAGSVSTRVLYAGKHSPDKLCDYYNAADVLCNPALNEGFGLIYLEAIACGLPVIGSKETGAEDIILPENGLLVEKRNVTELMIALQKITSNPPVIRLTPAFKTKGSWERISDLYRKWLEGIKSN